MKNLISDPIIPVSRFLYEEEPKSPPIEAQSKSSSIETKIQELSTLDKTTLDQVLSTYSDSEIIEFKQALQLKEEDLKQKNEALDEAFLKLKQKIDAIPVSQPPITESSPLEGKQEDTLPQEEIKLSKEEQKNLDDILKKAKEIKEKSLTDEEKQKLKETFSPILQSNTKTNTELSADEINKIINQCLTPKTFQELKEEAVHKAEEVKGSPLSEEEKQALHEEVRTQYFEQNPVDETDVQGGERGEKGFAGFFRSLQNILRSISNFASDDEYFYDDGYENQDEAEESIKQTNSMKDGKPQKELLELYNKLNESPDITIYINNFEEDINNIPKTSSGFVKIQSLISFLEKAEKGSELEQTVLQQNLTINSIELIAQNSYRLSLQEGKLIFNKKEIAWNDTLIQEQLQIYSQEQYTNFHEAILNSSKYFMGHPYARNSNGDLCDPFSLKKGDHWVTYQKHPRKKRVEGDKMPMVCSRFISEVIQHFGIDTASLRNKNSTDAIELWAPTAIIPGTDAPTFEVTKFKKIKRKTLQESNFQFQIGDILTINSNKDVRHIGIITAVDDKGFPGKIMDSSGGREGVYEVAFNRFGSSNSSIDQVIRITDRAKDYVKAKRNNSNLAQR